MRSGTDIGQSASDRAPIHSVGRRQMADDGWEIRRIRRLSPQAPPWIVEGETVTEHEERH
ncbi:hypothetical protein GCM10009700_02420 [Brevibacterium sanguinis]